MTRETRIGLLVGVGFIITFGLVLTELTGTGKPTPPPVLHDATGLALAPAEDISPAVVNLREVPLPLGAPLRPSPVASLMAAGRDAPAPAAAPAAEPAPEVVAVVHRQGDAQSAANSAAAPAPTLPIAPRVTSGAELVMAPPASPTPAAPICTYTVQPGDSLIKIARKVYGPGDDDAYKRIFEANRDKLTSPSLVAVGQVLVIPGPQAAPPAPGPVPAAAAARPAASGRTGVREVDLDHLSEALASPVGDSPRPSGGRGVYVVQRGDTLTRIARKTLKDDSPAAVMSIYEANQSTLSDPDIVPVGATLVIPG